MKNSRTMTVEHNDWAQTSTILGMAFAAVALMWKYVTELFKNRREARDAEIIRQERERAYAIKQAVKEGMESFNNEIRQEFKEYKLQNDKQFEYVNKRIDDVMLKLDK